MPFAPRVILYGRPEDGRFGALAQGCAAAGAEARWSAGKYFTAADVRGDASAVVVNGLGVEGRRIADAYAPFGIPVWVVEFPRLRDEPDAVGLLKDDLQWLPDAPNGRAVFDAGKVKRTPTEALVVLQKPHDAAHGMDAAQMLAWARETVALVKAETGLPVAVRPHPMGGLAWPDDDCGADRVSTPEAESIREALAQAVVVVTYNSTVGWDGIVAGVPVVALARASYAPYATALAAKPKALSAASRAEALALAASTQWTIDELRDGQAVRAMLASPSREG